MKILTDSTSLSSVTKRTCPKVQHKYTHMLARAQTHKHKRARAHAHTHTHARAHIHAHAHTHTHTHTHTRTHTHTHTYRQARFALVARNAGCTLRTLQTKNRSLLSLVQNQEPPPFLASRDHRLLPAVCSPAKGGLDPNTKRFKRTLIYFNTDTQYANFLGNPLYQATK